MKNKIIIIAIIIGAIIPFVLHPLNITIFTSGIGILAHILGAILGLIIGLILKKLINEK